MLLHRDHLCGSAMSTHAPFIVEVEGERGGRTQTCTWVCVHTHTLILLGFSPQGTHGYWNSFPTRLERNSHMALLTSTVKRTSPQVHRKEVIKRRLTQNPYGYQAFPRFLDSNIKEMNIASPGLLCKQSFLLKEMACAQGRRQGKKKKVPVLQLEEVGCFYNKREDLSHDHWEFPEIVKLLSSVAGDPGVAMEDRESFCEEL